MTDAGRERTQVGKWMEDDCDVYVGRGRSGKRFGSAEIGEHGWLGNPYRADEHGREECIQKFRGVFERRLNEDEDLRAAIAELSGKTLGCWCRSVDEHEPPCHADVIAEHAERLAEKPEIRTDGGADESRREWSRGDPITECKLDNLGKENISQHSTDRLRYVLKTLNDADELSRDLVWQSELWPGCTVEELLGGLIEAERLLDASADRDV